MGYQESYLTTKNKKDFDELVSFIKDLGKEHYENFFAIPVEIIKFNQSHPPFMKNQKAIYIVGERYPQTNFQKEIIPNFEKKCELIFTEYVDPYGIWEDAGDSSHVEHIPFVF